MAGLEVEAARDYAPRKRFKTSELPLSSSQRSTIDSLLHTIKKKGEYDALRKRVWAQYIESEDKVTFTDSLNDLAEAEIDRDPSLLSRERGKAATLMQGAVDRSDIYKGVESSLDALIAEHIGHVEGVAREIRRNEIGQDVAVEEEKRGNKPDEEYAREAIVRREAREKQREKEEARKRREEEVEKLRAEEAKKKAELDKLRRADERRREHEAREEKRAKDREAHRALLKQKEKEEELKREERRKEDLKRSQARDRSSDHRRDYRESEGIPRGRELARPTSRSPPCEKSATPPPPPPVDEKALEVAALELLLREGRELAAKSGSRIEQDRSESLEPPSLRKTQSVKPPKLAEPSPPKGPSADRSRSPQTGITIPKGPKLSYSHTQRLLDSPPPEPVQRRRSLSRTQTRRESTSDPYKSYDSDPKSARERHASSKYMTDEDAYRRSRDPSRSREHREEERRSYYESNDASSRPRDYERNRSYERERDREKDRDKHRVYEKERYRSRDYEYEKEKYRSSRDYEYEKDKYRSSRQDRPRSREGDRDRDRDRARRYERSRSGERSSHHRSTGYIENRSSRTGDRPRAKSPVEIDRYVPSTSSRAKELEPRSHRDRSKLGLDGVVEEPKEKSREYDRERERYSEKDRYGERDRERERHSDKDRYAERERDKDRYAERERDKDREMDRGRERYGERERETDRGREKYSEKDGYVERERERKPFVEIDRYVPGGSDRGRDRDRERDRERRERSR